MTESIEQLLYDGVMALGAGDRQRAQQLLLRVVEVDESNEQAWLWLSGAVDDPADQQVALENVLALNPNNLAAQRGLEFLRRQSAPNVAGAAPGGEWVPPPPRSPDDVDELTCWQCNATLYSVATYCFQCHAPVHSCENCVYRMETRCKELQGLHGNAALVALNSCEWWTPRK